MKWVEVLAIQWGCDYNDQFAAESVEKELFEEVKACWIRELETKSLLEVIFLFKINLLCDVWDSKVNLDWVTFKSRVSFCSKSIFSW